MPAEKFKLPKSSYEELVKIIKAYGHFNEAASLEDVSRLIGMHNTVISRNTGFLIEVSILEPGSKKRLTSAGFELARALEHEMPDEIRRWWQKIVEESDFLSKLLSAIRIRSGMDDATLQAHIAYSAGQPKKKDFMTGARTVIDVLRAAELVSEKDGKIVVINDAENNLEEPDYSIDKEFSTKPVAQKMAGPSSIDFPITQAIASVGNSQISINIEIKIDCKASEIEGLGKKLRSLIDDFQKEDSNNDENEA